MFAVALVGCGRVRYKTYNHVVTNRYTLTVNGQRLDGVGSQYRQRTALIPRLPRLRHSPDKPPNHPDLSDSSPPLQTSVAAGATMTIAPRKVLHHEK